MQRTARTSQLIRRLDDVELLAESLKLFRWGRLSPLIHAHELMQIAIDQRRDGGDHRQQLASKTSAQRLNGDEGRKSIHHLGHAAELGANFQPDLRGTFKIQVQSNAFVLAGEAHHPSLLGELLGLTHQQRGGSA